LGDCEEMGIYCGKFDGTFWANLNVLEKNLGIKVLTWIKLTQTYEVCDYVSRLIASSSGQNLENKLQNIKIKNSFYASILNVHFMPTWLIRRTKFKFHHYKIFRT
jgi:hypothetical protein